MSQTTVAGSFITVNTIDSDHYIDGSIDLAHIGANQIDGTKLALASQAAGDVMYYNGTDWIRLAKGTADQILTMNDGATAPGWETAAASGVSNPLTSGSFVLNDNAKLGLGTSSGESEIYSDGTNVYWDTSDDVPIIFRDVTTNNTTKASRLGFGHYVNSNKPVMMMSGNSTSSGSALYIGGGRSNMYAATSINIYTAANNTTNAGTSRLLISETGYISMPYQPAFLAYNSATDSDVTGGGGLVTVDMDTEIFDQGADFLNDTFTAPYVGRYLLTASILARGITTSSTDIRFDIYASNRRLLHVANFAGLPDGLPVSGIIGDSISIVMDMDANDIARVEFSVTGESGTPVDIDGASDMRTSFSGHLVA